MIFTKLIDLLRIKFSKNKGELYSYIIEISGVVPKNIALYEEALRHKSAVGKSNERLEYLGDALISLVIAQDLFVLFPKADEGTLTRYRAQAVCRENLNKIAHKIGLDKHLRTSQHIKKNTENIYGNAFEAITGAIYLDAGFDSAAAFVREHISGKDGKRLYRLTNKETDFKSRLLEYAQSKHVPAEFRLINDEYVLKEDKHIFTCEIIIDNESAAVGFGNNKMQAQQDAARKALKKINKTK